MVPGGNGFIANQPEPESLNSHSFKARKPNFRLSEPEGLSSHSFKAPKLKFRLSEAESLDSLQSPKA